MKRLAWTVTEKQEGSRLEVVLRQEYGLSRRQIIRLKNRPGSVLVNGLHARMGAILARGDAVQIAMEEHLEPVLPQAIPLSIVYEDHDLIIIDKPAGLVSHPTKGYASGTLANALVHHCRQPARLVTRLDRETSGLVLGAKSAWSHHRLSKDEIHKEYLAITRGVPDPPAGIIDLPIGRSPDNPQRRGINPLGQPALTRYRTERRGKELAIVHLEPVTGRTHQLRIHMAHIGCPLLDDFMYGIEEGIMGRTALHALKLCFTHPHSGQPMEFSAPLPEDFLGVIEQMR